MTTVIAKHGRVATTMILALVVLATFGGCAQRREHNTYHLAAEGPVVRVKLSGEPDGIAVRPTKARVSSERGRHFVSIHYEIVQESSSATVDFMRNIPYKLYSPDTHHLAVNGKQLSKHRVSLPNNIRINPVRPHIEYAGVMPQDRIVMNATVPILEQYIYRGDLKAFELTLDLDIIRKFQAIAYGLAEDCVSVVATEPEAKWSFVRDRSR